MFFLSPEHIIFFLLSNYLYCLAVSVKPCVFIPKMLSILEKLEFIGLCRIKFMHSHWKERHLCRSVRFLVISFSKPEFLLLFNIARNLSRLKTRF